MDYNDEDLDFDYYDMIDNLEVSGHHLPPTSSAIFLAFVSIIKQFYPIILISFIARTLHLLTDLSAVRHGETIQDVVSISSGLYQIYLFFGAMIMYDLANSMYFISTSIIYYTAIAFLENCFDHSSKRKKPIHRKNQILPMLLMFAPILLNEYFVHILGNLESLNNRAPLMTLAMKFMTLWMHNGELSMMSILSYLLQSCFVYVWSMA